ncbi:MAG: Ig domain-containing protein, partial [Nitrososphaerales archaeon]
CKVNGEGTNNAAVGGFYVDVQAPSALTVTTTSLPAATPGESYSAQLSASGGFSPHRWKIVSGTLPKGLRIHGTKGVISGTCSKDAATSTFTVEVSTPGSEPHTRDTAEASLTIEVS